MPEVYDYRIVSSDGASTYRLPNYETRQKMRALAGKKKQSDALDPAPLITIVRLMASSDVWDPRKASEYEWRR